MDAYTKLSLFVAAWFCFSLLASIAIGTFLAMANARKALPEIEPEPQEVSQWAASETPNGAVTTATSLR